jgi:uncharacterized protein YdaU (DUF1376 family)
MSSDPAFLFYPNDWLGGTLGMTFEEKGAYMELLMLQFNRGHMTAHMIGQTIGQLWVKVQDKFLKDEDGLYYNARLEKEIIKRKNYVKSRNNNKEGKNQYPKKEEKDSSDKEGHMTGHMENEDEDVNKDLINYKSLLETFHFYCPNLSKVVRLSGQRKKHVDARFKEFDYDTILDVIKKVGSSDFLNGKNDRCWKADFDWIFLPTNFVKIVEGKYANKINGSKHNGTEVEFRRTAKDLV